MQNSNQHFWNGSCCSSTLTWRSFPRPSSHSEPMSPYCITTWKNRKLQIHPWLISSLLLYIFTFLLAYISCTVEFHCDLYTYAYNVPYLIYHIHSSPSPFLKTILAGFNVLLSYRYIKYIHHIHPSIPSPLPLPLPVILTSKQNLLYLLVHFRLYLTCSMGFHHDLSHMCVFYLGQVNFLLLYPLCTSCYSTMLHQHT
jgi:hypothetical protein